MENRGQPLQDEFLNTLRKDRILVSIFLVNGIKLRGRIEAFDSYVVLLEAEATLMIFKHAISSILPVSHTRYPGPLRVMGDRQA